MTTRYLSKETRTDYAGTYTAYIYADGHVETDPPGRPLFREDVQRQRRKEYALRQATRVLEVERAKAGVRQLPNAIERANETAVSGRALNEGLRATLEAFATVAGTIGTPRSQALELINNFDVGGPLVGDAAGTEPEYGYARPPRGEEASGTIREERYPLEGY